jgi:polyhydroxybutyrate depolymerase
MFLIMRRDVVKTIQTIVAVMLSVAVSAGAEAASKTTAVTGTINPVNGMLTTSAAFTYSFPEVSGAYIAVAAGTTAYSATISVAGTSRTYIVMRPVAAPSSSAPPPLLVLLHPLDTTPVQMANLTEVTKFVATQGFWVVLPQAINGQWDDDPALTPSTDTNFISALITTMVAQGVDATRVYAAGYSDGAFMSERLACELSNQIAAFGIDAGAVISSSPTYCKPAVQRPKLYILGTADNIVPYDGGMVGVDSAAASMAFWVGQQHCGGTVATTLPTLVSDGTTVQLTDYTGCTAGHDLRLYTVDNGGHAWPNGLTQSVGKTTQNLDATGIIWSFASAYHL